MRGGGSLEVHWKFALGPAQAKAVPGKRYKQNPNLCYWFILHT